MIFRYLTSSFFTNYVNCTQMLQKQNRPYAHIIIEIDEGLNFALPIRHGIKHPYAFFTDDKKTQGLDYSKAVLIVDVSKYTDNARVAIINGKEYFKIVQKENFIIKQFMVYIKLYKKAYKKQNIETYKILCSMSCLQYFHLELGIEQ